MTDEPTDDTANRGTESATDDETGAATSELTHTDESGNVQMVDVGAKPDTARRAVARGTVHLQPSTVEAIRADGTGEAAADAEGDEAVTDTAELEKGDVLATARVGAIQAVKHTWETIPMCHQIPITNVDASFDVREDRVTLTVAVETTGKTGCEMEALEGVTTGLNVVWDMVKAAEKNADGQYPETRITDVEVVEKEKRELE